MKNSRVSWLWVTFFVLLFLPMSAQAATLIVPDDYQTIQAGIDATVNGDEVMVRDGIYNELINFNGKAIRLYSENGAAGCIIDGDVDGDGTGDGSVVTFSSGEISNSVLDGFTVQNGVSSFGGGIHCASSPSITNCTITGNNATSLSGGGGGIDCESSPSITNCTITGNNANSGSGGIFCYTSSPSITNCTITGNTANSGSGGISCIDYSSPSITNCTITGNTAPGGGGIECYMSSPSITNCTITGNTATSSSGGGIGCFYSSPIVLNSVLWGNEAAGVPNEIYLYGSGSISVTYSDIRGGWTGTGNIDADPLFVDAVNADYHLQYGSPCMNAGNATGGAEYDFEGNPRFYYLGGDGMPDMGADEAHIMYTSLKTNAAQFTTGEDIIMQTFVNNYTPGNILVDINLEVILPDSSALLLTSSSGVTVPGYMTNYLHTLYNHTFTGYEPAGTYKLRFTVTSISSQNVLSQREVNFVFNP